MALSSRLKVELRRERHSVLSPFHQRYGLTLDAREVDFQQGFRCLFQPPKPMGRVMSFRSMADLDFIEELRLRRWARENYVAEAERNDGWHPIVLDEMNRKDAESFIDDPSPSFAMARV